MLRRWRRREPWCIDQVANGPDSGLNLTPASAAPAEAVKASWAVWLPGQAVPLIWERTFDHAEPCEDD
jgi:hypothetical protein